MAPDLFEKKRIHIIAVGGAAMSAIAHICDRMGHLVTGSDQNPSDVLERLRGQGLDVWSPHDVGRLGSPDLVMLSAAVPASNPELVALQAKGIPIATRADVMESLGRLRRTVAISGTAGKTTTAAMMATVAHTCGLAPSMIVGATIHGLGNGVEWKDSEWLVVEADESDGSFLRFNAEAVIVTNIEPDHLDYWGSMNALESAFDQFVNQASGPKVLNADDPGCTALRERIGPQDGLVTFGTDRRATYRITNYKADGLQTTFNVVSAGRAVIAVELSVPGLHNAMNAVAVLAMAIELGLTPSDVAAGLSAFRGASRRFEFRGVGNGVTFVDDYAHLPAKARSAVEAALLGNWPRVVAVYQPHRYTRTRDLWKDHADSFVGVDLLIITGIYAAGQQPIPGVTGKLIAEEVQRTHPEQRVLYCETRDELVATLERELREGDLCLTMNAGDLTTLPDQLLHSPWNNDGATT